MTASARVTKAGNKEFEWGKRTYIMGIINTSPESFSGDGVTDTGAVIEQARRFEAAGADILDIGGESTKPGAAAIPLEVELNRVVPVIETLAKTVAVPISVDSYKSEVVSKAIAEKSMVSTSVSLLTPTWFAVPVSRSKVRCSVLCNSISVSVALAITSLFWRVRFPVKVAGLRISTVSDTPSNSMNVVAAPATSVCRLVMMSYAPEDAPRKNAVPFSASMSVRV